MTISTEAVVAQSPVRSTYDWVVLIGLPPILLGLILYVGWLIASAYMHVSDSDIAEAGRESICVKEGLQTSLKRDVPVTKRALIDIRAKCSEFMHEQVDAEANRLAAKKQRSALESEK